jgi:ubiquinone/menaquinone biosynthesis C-methylase UbiE
VSDLHAVREFWAKEFENWKTRGSKKGYGAELISKQLKGKTVDGADVLEIGFGDGRFLELFRNLGARPHGIDILPKAAKGASLRGIPVCVGDARDLPFPDDHFELTCSFGVFEHFGRTKKAVSEHSDGFVAPTARYVEVEASKLWQEVSQA